LNLAQQAELYRVMAAKLEMQMQRENLLQKLDKIDENIEAQEKRIKELEELLSKE